MSASSSCEWPIFVESFDLAFVVPTLFTAACTLTLPVPRRLWPNALFACVVVMIHGLPLFEAASERTEMLPWVMAWMCCAPAALVGAVHEHPRDTVTAAKTSVTLTEILSLGYAVLSGINVYGLTQFQVQGGYNVTALDSVPHLLFSNNDTAVNAVASLSMHGSAAALMAQICSARLRRVSLATARVFWIVWTLGCLGVSTWLILDRCDDSGVNITQVCTHYHPYPVCESGAIVGECRASALSVVLPVWILVAVGVSTPATRWLHAHMRSRPFVAEVVCLTLAVATIIPFYWALVGSAQGPNVSGTCAPWDTWAMMWYSYAAMGSVGFSVAVYGAALPLKSICQNPSQTTQWRV